MYLHSVSYKEHEGENLEWILDELVLGQVNLLVGKNASGKTRTLNVIGNFAKMLCGEHTHSLRSGDYCLVFHEDKSVIEYTFKADKQIILSELLTVDGKTRLKRESNGEGMVFAEKVNNGTDIEFQAQTDELAAVAKRDAKQHPFLDRLFIWGNSTRHYHFGTHLGKNVPAFAVKRGGDDPDGKHPDKIVAIFGKGKRDFKASFVDGIIEDMKKVGYPITEIDVGPPVARIILLDTEQVGLIVQEEGLKCKTDQGSMSQGMFRVLAIIILSRFFECRKMGGLMLIDDIGEGLDFDRSCRLIDLLREKANQKEYRLIMSTNDQFTMNRVPMEEWVVLQREKHHIKVLTQANSKTLFDDFKFTGLSNFSFLEMDFANSHEPTPSQELAP